MRASSAKAKGRRLQVQVAEALARTCGLTILAIPPTKPGKRNGVEWVPEGVAADLKVRPMGQAGPDVALLTETARKAVAWMGRPFHVECKNVEGWSFDRMAKTGRLAPAVRAGLTQARRGRQNSAREYPLLVIGRNQMPPFVVYDVIPREKLIVLTSLSFAVVEGWHFLRLDQFVTLVDGAKGRE